MRVSRFMRRAVSEGKGSVLAQSEYRAARREAAKKRYHEAKRGRRPRVEEPARPPRPIRQNTKFDRWF